MAGNTKVTLPGHCRDRKAFPLFGHTYMWIVVDGQYQLVRYDARGGHGPEKR